MSKLKNLPPNWQIEHDAALAARLAKLHDRILEKRIVNPRPLKGKLRAYQKRGEAWLQYLEQLDGSKIAAEAPDTVPSVFVLSIKAGGVAITLIKANFMFHFERG